MARRLLGPLVIVLVAIAAAVAGGGAYATWSGTAAQSQAISSGSLTATFGAAGTSANRISLAITDMTAGVPVFRPLDVTNGADLTALQMSTGCWRARPPRSTATPPTASR